MREDPLHPTRASAGEPPRVSAPGRAAPALAAGLLFCSGATALVYEVAWGKWLGNLLGNGGEAHAVVLAAFLGGLALGARLFGGLADRVERPLRLYGWLELGVAAWALAFPLLLDALAAAWLAVAPGLPERGRCSAAAAGRGWSPTPACSARPAPRPRPSPPTRPRPGR